MKKARRILVLTLSFGSGHVKAAQAVARELGRQEPGAEVRVVDALEDCRLLFRACYAWPYWAMVRYAPALWDRFFAARVTRGDASTAPAWALRWGCPQVFKLIEEFQPETIVAAEVAACEMSALAKRAGLTRARIINVITDHEAEPIWVKPEVDLYAVADADVREQLCAWGAQAEQVTVCGIPTDAAFSMWHDTEETRRRHGIKGDAPLVLLMGGGMGPTRMDAVAALLCRSGVPLHVVAVAGRDACARRRLARLEAVPPVSLRVLAWTDDIAALMQAASVLVTKPGGLTTAEAALSALPVVFFDAIPGPERRNAARMADAGAGVITDSPEEAATATLSLLRDEGTRHRMADCTKKLSSPNAAATVARLALDVREPSRGAAERMTA
ncbi:MAG: processive 1,2-diacylglycerol beta-glucosyltransferase [Acidobacteriota bacterium]|jgi:processive 1,2-diacylglycerol beta-glucosyltransferase|nr:processive 1,2-diacylglycerol beta-glucosyltransferase [Acidobacteriota bacterium]